MCREEEDQDSCFSANLFIKWRCSPMKSLFAKLFMGEANITINLKDIDSILKCSFTIVN